MSPRRALASAHDHWPGDRGSKQNQTFPLSLNPRPRTLVHVQDAHEPAGAQQHAVLRLALRAAGPAAAGGRPGRRVERGRRALDQRDVLRA